MDTNLTSSLLPLKALLGVWHTTGEVSAEPGKSALRVEGTDTYEAVLDGAFILHRVDVMMGEERSQAIELIGEYDAATHTYQMRAFGSDGTYTTMQARMHEHRTFHLGATTMRARLTPGNAGALTQLPLLL